MRWRGTDDDAKTSCPWPVAGGDQISALEAEICPGSLRDFFFLFCLREGVGDLFGTTAAVELIVLIELWS